MASVDLKRLWRLHTVDVAISEIKQRAANLDVGQKEMKRLKELEQEDAGIGKEARDLARENIDLELKQKGYEEKLEKFRKQLFSGAVTNSREIEAIEKEIAMLTRNRNALDDRLLELMEVLPPKAAAADKLAKEIEASRKIVAAKHDQALEERHALEAAFKAETARRAEAAKQVSVSLLTRYESNRARHNGVGMGEITRKGTCSACGTAQPARTIEAAKEEKIVACEGCHRILYYTEGVV